MTTPEAECDALNSALRAAKSTWRVFPHRSTPATQVEIVDAEGDSIFVLDRGVTVPMLVTMQRLYNHGYEHGRRVGEGMALRRVRQALGLGCA